MQPLFLVKVSSSSLQLVLFILTQWNLILPSGVFTVALNALHETQDIICFITDIICFITAKVFCNTKKNTHKRKSVNYSSIFLDFYKRNTSIYKVF